MTLIGNHRVFVGLWSVIMVSSLALFAFVGLNYGLDFTGGTILERSLPGDVTTGEIRQLLTANTPLDFSSAVIQRAASEQPGQSVIIIRTTELTNEQITQIDKVLSEAYGSVDKRRTEVVGPVIGRQLIRNALLALLLSAVGVLAYLSVRFEYRFGLAALLAVLHDVFFVVGAMSLLRTEINTPFVAAILTVIGYSLNNSIIIFDRVRENLAIRKNEPFLDLVNRSVRQTLARTVNTSLTTLLALLAVWVLGGSTIRDFILALVIGLVVGTFSSIFLAPSLWLAMQREPEAAAKAAAR